MEPRVLHDLSKLLQQRFQPLSHVCFHPKIACRSIPLRHYRPLFTEQHPRSRRQWKITTRRKTKRSANMAQTLGSPSGGVQIALSESKRVPIELQLFQGVWDRHRLARQILGAPPLPSNERFDSYSTFASFSDNSIEIGTHYIRTPRYLTIDWEELGIPDDEVPAKLASKEIYLQGATGIAEPTLTLDQLDPKERAAFEDRLAGKLGHSPNPDIPSKKSLKRQTRIAANKDKRKAAIARLRTQAIPDNTAEGYNSGSCDSGVELSDHSSESGVPKVLMTSDSRKTASTPDPDASPARHRPLVVGLTKPSSPSKNMASTDAAAALNHAIEKNLNINTQAAAPAEATTAESSQPKQKKEKTPKQPKPPKAAPAAAPTSPALIDLRVGHILRAIAHPNADSLYVSTIAMGDPEGTEHTQVDEETGKVVRTVCSGLNGLVPLSDMQNRKIIVVANLKPVNMRSIKSAAMVLAASPKQEEGADPHAADRVVELVIPPEGAEAGDKVYFEGWPYGEGKGPEKQLNPKKKQWEAIQPGFYTSDDLVVGFDASQCDEVASSDKGNLVVEGKGVCTVKTLKGAVVR